MTIPAPFESYTPSECVYDLIYTATLFDKVDSPLPDFITFSADKGFELKSSDPNDFGMYEVLLSATVDGPSRVGTVTVRYWFNVGRCLLDTMNQAQPIGDVQYMIDSGPLVVATNIENLFDECPLTFELTQNGGPFDTDIFFIDIQARTIVIETDDMDLDGVSFDMVLTVTDTSGETMEYEFEVTFGDRCSMATLTGAQFLDSSV